MFLLWDELFLLNKLNNKQETFQSSNDKYPSPYKEDSARDSQTEQESDLFQKTNTLQNWDISKVY
jgi:hypothetical protein